MSDIFSVAFYRALWISIPVVFGWLLHGWCLSKLLPSRRRFCVHHTTRSKACGTVTRGGGAESSARIYPGQWLCGLQPSSRPLRLVGTGLSWPTGGVSECVHCQCGSAGHCLSAPHRLECTWTSWRLGVRYDVIMTAETTRWRHRRVLYDVIISAHCDCRPRLAFSFYGPPAYFILFNRAVTFLVCFGWF